MLEDSVLRCLVRVQIAGAIIPDVFDAVRDGAEFLIVSEWGSQLGDPEARQTPKEFFKVPAAWIEVAPAERADYELICTETIDWNGLVPTDRPAPISRSFQRPPDE